ncbi:transcription factor bHLH153 isoform X2 [Prosopis cineraria]|uniref:transcription factor bHLH153 isoform X2 n=1 Tax=Prosopis cineraria TaxID=364024 RepID=UPI00240F7689|nr:transcription factor bHLH153 isoform X2 [Prosopis cineraria]
MTASSFCNADSVFSREEGVDIRKMMEPKRSFCSVDQSNYTSIASKRQKADLSISTKERKEKIGERIVALQQLVSPFGKSDTASVLLEATHYIRFLHKQVLSAPYLQCSPTTKTQDIGIGAYSLRSRGLCLVPVSYTIGVAQSNGADIWAPTKSTPSQFA